MSCRSDPPGWWRDIPGTNGKYQCSRGGEVRRVLAGGRTRAMQPRPPCASCHRSAKSRLQVHLRLEGRDVFMPVITIVARTWKPPLPPGRVWHHKNGNSFDNRAENIAPIDRRTLGQKTGGRATRRSVEKIDRAGNVVALYESVLAAARAEHMSHEAIRARCVGRIREPYALTGYTYRFEE